MKAIKLILIISFFICHKSNAFGQSQEDVIIISIPKEIPVCVSEFVENKANSYKNDFTNQDFRIRDFCNGIFEIYDMNNMNAYYIDTTSCTELTTNELKSKFKNFNINDLKNIMTNNLKSGTNSSKALLDFHLGEFYGLPNYQSKIAEIPMEMNTDNFANYLGYHILYPAYQNVNHLHFESHYFYDATDNACINVDDINYCIRAIAPIRIIDFTTNNILNFSTHEPNYNNYCFDYNGWGQCIEEVPDNVGWVRVLYTFDMTGQPPFLLHTGIPGACDPEADTYTFDYGENIYISGSMGTFDSHCANLGYPYYFSLKLESLDPPYNSYEKILSVTESSNIINGVFNLSTFCSQHGITLYEGKYKITLGAYDCMEFNGTTYIYRSLNQKRMYIVACPYGKYITNGIYDFYIAQAASYIEANNYIETSEKVIYKAQDYIKLTAGFNVKVLNNGNFTALIGPCGVGCNDYRLLSSSNPTENYIINLSENPEIKSNNYLAKKDESEKNELSDEEKTIIFPNPFNNNIQIINPYKNISIKVYDISGSDVFSKEYISDKKIDLDLSEFSSGTYFIKITSKEKIIIKKIIKM